MFPVNPQPGDVYRRWTWNGKVWACTDGGGNGGGVEEAPLDGKMYVRQNGTWVELPHLGGIAYVGPDEPEDPETGELWWDTTDGTLHIWDGSAWQDAEGIAGPPGPEGPPGPQGSPGPPGADGQDGADGDLWPVHGVIDDSWPPAEMVGEAFQFDIGVESPVDLGNPQFPIELDLSPGNYTVWIDMQATTQSPPGTFTMYVEVDSVLRPENTMKMGPLTDVHVSTCLHVSSEFNTKVNVYATYPASTSGWMGYCSIKARRMF
jgi:hypothetical protein